MVEEKIPQHIAIIPDGNRRWARQKMLRPWQGHEEAGTYEHLSKLFREAKKLGVKYISFWGFSTDNWNRDKEEVAQILKVVSRGLDRCIEEAEKEKFCFRHVGRKDRLPKKLLTKLEKLEKITKKYSDAYVLLFLDYGGRDEILRAVNKLLKEKTDFVDEKKFVECLDTQGIPDPDLIIRTGGEMRLSGLMPFQSDYAELYFTKIHFPDFDARTLRKAVKEFSRRNRRFGQ